MKRGRQDVVRVYYTLRSVHLERAATYAPALILFAHRNYDFDASQTADLDLVGGPLWRRLAVLARSRPRVLEINEPLMRPGIAQTAAAVLIVRIANGRHTRIVTYAIENLDPYGATPPTWKARLRRGFEWTLAKNIAARVDRIVFGTAGAQQLYADVFGRRLPGEQSLVPALPAPCACLTAGPPDKDADAVVFVGEFSERKGIPELLAAWPQVRHARVDARLTLIGTGPLLPDVQAFARDHEDVSLLVNPARTVIHAQLRTAAVVVLLSGRTTTWREQVGLPIVEGLAHGARIVTTTETGLADWLRACGHAVVNPQAPSAEVAAAIVRQLAAAPMPGEVLSTLPRLDGREVADRHLTE